MLLSLLLGFTLAMALARFDERKHLVVDEANAIGTTSWRAQMLAEPARGKMLDLLREYFEARIGFSGAGLHGQELAQSLARGKQLQNEMWQQSVEVARQSPTTITSLFVQSLNESIDLSEKRLAMLENRVPTAIWVMLALAVDVFDGGHDGAAKILVRDDLAAADDCHRDGADRRSEHSADGYDPNRAREHGTAAAGSAGYSLRADGIAPRPRFSAKPSGTLKTCQKRPWGTLLFNTK